MLSSKCTVCRSEKSRFLKELEAKGLLSSLGIRTRLSNIPVLGKILFYFCITMNEIVNRFLLAGDKFMPEMHLKQLDLLKTKSLNIYANRKCKLYLQQ